MEYLSKLTVIYCLNSKENVFLHVSPGPFIHFYKKKLPLILQLHCVPLVPQICLKI